MRRWTFSLSILGIAAALLGIWNPFTAPESEAAEPRSPKPVERVTGATLVVKVVDPNGRPASAVVSALPLAGGGQARNFYVSSSGTQRMELPSGKWLLTACTELSPEGRTMGAIVRKTVDLPVSGELLVELEPRQGNLTVEFEVRLPAGKWASNSPFLLPEGTSLTTQQEVRRAMGALPHPGAIFGSAMAGTNATRFTLSQVTAGRYVVAVLISQEGAPTQYAFSVPVELSAAAKQSVVMTAPKTLIVLDGY